ncbi:carboxymethylenebutenolidase [Pseudoxanthobacter soli DSM 19599]|uniref:Carboxymethylenebutenolidase n=1 Tax=Pseudoxanthobacter soli DSM 19599 TaxID=1123029 RepID=A0A1M7Z684_9HYPH|nr:dienelactone hydrolase family protein [Pseudoxanthobacter soli]SHO60379.1 carboxymethylenebutenolidase [Pseudoxanthobacter soli DSM 19599]
MAESIVLETAAGRSVSAYLARAAEPDAPGIVVIQEWWGVQAQIRGVCDRYAAAGFTAIAPDLYDGKVIPYHDREGAGQAMNALDFLAATDEVAGAAARFLKAEGRRVGLTGFCLGGVVSILGAIRLADIDAASAYYGAPDDALDDAARVRVPVQAHFADRDHWCTPADADRMERRFAASGQPFSVFRYACDHGFANEDEPRFDRAAADLAWQRDMAWWGEHLAAR